MNLQLNLPNEFSEILNKQVQEIYSEAILTARKDVGLLREYLSIEEVCGILDISRNTLTTNYFGKGLPKYKVGNRQYVKKTELNNFINQHQIL